MIITLKCKFCNDKIQFNTNDEQNNVTSCPHCGHYFQKHHYINDLIEKIYAFESISKDVELNSIFLENTAAKYPEHQLNVFLDDLKSFEKTYYNSENEVKNIFSNIIDLVFLITYHDARQNKVDDLQNFHKLLRDYFDNRVSKKHDDN